jgi:hypothetical protein
MDAQTMEAENQMALVPRRLIRTSLLKTLSLESPTSFLARTMPWCIRANILKNNEMDERAAIKKTHCCVWMRGRFREETPQAVVIKRKSMMSKTCREAPKN